MGPAEDRNAAGAPRRLTILLIAYEFPPSPSPQSLRWAYLTRELVLRGHRVHVLAPEHPGTGEGLPALPADIVVHRTFAGPAMGLLNAMARRGRRKKARSADGRAAESDGVRAPDSSSGAGSGMAAPLAPLNWKGRLHNAFNRQKTAAFHAAQRLTATWFFPDGRAEWYPWAKRSLDVLLRELPVDLVISSHEPATSLSLGLLAHRKGLPWIADLGDPVLAPYTPVRWRQRARRLEGDACMAADRVLVTNPAVAGLLVERHAIPERKLEVLTQGFDGRFRPSPETASDGGSNMLELLYTGSFYSFRRAGPLLDAVLSTPGVRLNIASIAVPEDVRAVSQRSPSVRLLGFLPHVEALSWQRRCDVLVNLANEDSCQVPGKFYEYLGAGRPILHIGGGGGDDAAAQLLLDIHRGWVCRADAAALARLLGKLREDAVAGRMPASLDLSAAAVQAHDWVAIGARLDGIINTLMLERER